MSTIQRNYEKNLGGTAFGTPLRHPVLFRENSGRVGDVGYFDHNGNWRWIRNAFDSQVNPTSISTGIVSLNEHRA